MIDVTCRCGHVSHSEEQHIGKHLRCPKCGEPVPILRAARAMVQPPTASQTTQTNQPRQRKLRRFRSLYAVAVAIAVMVLAGSWLVAHFRSRGIERGAATPSASDASGTAIKQGDTRVSQANEGEDQSIKWEVVDAPPIPTKPKRTPSFTSAPIPQDRAPIEQEPSLPNGARIASDVGIDGRGELNVNNGTAEDAEIILYNVERDEQARDVNVKAHNLLQITGIPVGTYELKYAQGPSCYQFDSSLDYTEHRTDGGNHVWVNYKEISVTLHSVVGGNVRTKRISRSDFLKGHPAARPLKAQTTGQ